MPKEQVECLKCTNIYDEGDNELILVCPHCGNDDMLETVYLTVDEVIWIKKRNQETIT